MQAKKLNIFQKIAKSKKEKSKLTKQQKERLNECGHPQNKTYRDICNGNALRCGVCNMIITTKIGDNTN